VLPPFALILNLINQDPTMEVFTSAYLQVMLKLGTLGHPE
jgi:hypothetical protein